MKRCRGYGSSANPPSGRSRGLAGGGYAQPTAAAHDCRSGGAVADHCTIGIVCASVGVDAVFEQRRSIARECIHHASLRNSRTEFAT